VAHGRPVPIRITIAAARDVPEPNLLEDGWGTKTESITI